MFIATVENFTGDCVSDVTDKECMQCRYSQHGLVVRIGQNLIPTTRHPLVAILLTHRASVLHAQTC